MEGSRNWIAPSTGIVLVALIIAITLMIGQGQDPTDKTAQEIANHYDDSSTTEAVASCLIGLAGVFMLFFAGWLRRLLRDSEGDRGILSTVVFGAGVVFAAGAAVGGSIHLALADLADDLDPVAIQAINGIDFDFFLFFPVGMGTMMLAAGISAIRHGALPKWLAWGGIVVAVLFASPAFFVGFVGMPLWILIVSIIGISRARGDAAPPAGSPA